MVEFGCFRLLAVLSYLIQTYGCAELLFRILYFPISFSCLSPLTPRAFPKILLFFSQVIFLFTSYFSKSFPHRMNPQLRHFLRLNQDSALNPALSVLILCVNPTYFLFCKHTLANTLVIYTFRIRNFCKQLRKRTPFRGCVRFAGRFRPRGFGIS